MSAYVLIPLLPLTAFLIIGLGGRRLGAAAHRVAIPAVWLSFACSLAAVVEVVAHGPVSIALYRFIHSGDLIVDLGLYLDPLTVTLLPLITGVSGVVHVYSARYMIGDPRYARFFAVIALVTCAMVVLVMSSSLLLLYIAWEVMGLCSFLLISHAAERRSAGHAATKAFLMNVVADVGLGFGILLTFAACGTLDIQQVLARAGDIGGQTVNLLGWAGLEWPVRTVTLIALCLLVAVAGKSAQIPFHTWLPFAMEAPTPVSALSYAATMVNAGPFLLVRMSPLVALSPSAMAMMALIGGATALFAAVVSLTQSDIKKILAYSTVSQLGFMVMACGVGAFVAAIFHMLAHGCLKGFLFLSTGNALPSVPPRAPAATGPRVPLQRGALLGSLTLACIPPVVIFSGPYEQLWTVQQFASAHVAFWAVGLITVFVTAMYIFRGMTALFQHPSVAEGRDEGLRPRVFSPAHLLVIAFGAVAASGALAVCWTWFAHFLAPALGPSGADLGAAAATGWPALRPSWWMLVPLAAALCGWAAAYGLHVTPGLVSPGGSEWGKRLYVLFLNKGYVDELYEVAVVRPTRRWAGWLWKAIDLGCIDRAVAGAAGSAVVASRWLWRHVEMRGIDAPAGPDPLLAGVADRTPRAVAPRLLRHNVLVMVFWLIVAVGLFYVLAP